MKNEEHKQLAKQYKDLKKKLNHILYCIDEIKIILTYSIREQNISKILHYSEKLGKYRYELKILEKEIHNIKQKIKNINKYPYNKNLIWIKPIELDYKY